MSKLRLGFGKNDPRRAQLDIEQFLACRAIHRNMIDSGYHRDIYELIWIEDDIEPREGCYRRKQLRAAE